MPCGGIYPIKGTWVEALEKTSTGRMSCAQPNIANPPRVAVDIETTGTDLLKNVPPIFIENAAEFEPKMDCFQCGKTEPEPDHFCDEWDCFLHGACVGPFLETDEGKIVLSHKHRVTISIDGKTENLYEEM